MIRSPAYRDASRGQRCTFQIPDVCTGGGEDTVFCHLRDDHTGGAQKASDLSGADGCFACHNVMDRRAKMPDGLYIKDEDWTFFAFRALQRTMHRRVEQGVLIIKGLKL